MKIIIIIYLLIINQIKGEKCCSECLQKINVGIDALNFNKCHKYKTPCCFENECHSTKFTLPIYNTENLEFKEEEILIKTGKWLQFKWNDVTKVTYININKNQKKVSQPKYTSTEAIKKDDWFNICIENEGYIYYRGFKGEKGCKGGSYEYNITVEEGNKNEQCSIIPILPTLNLECNLNNGYIDKGECKCDKGFRNPPLCNKWPFWKWFATLGSAIAGSITITILIIKKIKKNKKKKDLERNITEITL